MALSQLLIASLATSASAVKLYVTSYAPDGSPVGAVSTLEFTPGVGGASLKVLSENKECGSAPTWLDTNVGDDRITCTNEGWSDPASSLNTFSIGDDGALKKIAQQNLTIQGPVSTQFFNDNSHVAVAHYGGSGISNLKVNTDGSFTLVQNWTFTEPTGPKPQQEAPHVHHAAIDPKGQFIVFPDLGSDFIRIYGVDRKTSLLKEQKSFVTKAGYGPRHAAFWQPKGRNPPTYLFVIYELVNKITSYKVDYANGTLGLTEIQEQSSYGPDREVPAGAAAAEITVSPDNRFVTASNRLAPIFKVPNPDSKNSTQIPSDSIIVLKPNDNGKLSFVQLAPSGGNNPRHFAVNPAGNLIAIGAQNDGAVSVFSRNVQSGKIGARVAYTKVFGSPNNIVWEEE